LKQYFDALSKFRLGDGVSQADI